jgi:radical SAM protein with 4Fe4S-binding SPASM domain
MNNTFPYIKGDFRLVVGPISYIHSIEGKKYYQLNRDATEIVLECNGKNSIEKIAQNLANKYEEEFLSTLETVKSYIFSQESFIEISNTPQNLDHEILGDWNIQSPAHVCVELTNKCNYYCKHCYNESGSQNNEFFNKDDYFRVADDLRDHGVVTVELTGGEPFMHPDFESILKYSLEKFDMIGVITNGSLITPEFLDSLVEYKDKVLFSVGLHASEKDYMDWFCGFEGAFDNAKRAIKLLNERGFRLRISMIINPLNICEISKTIGLAQSLGKQPNSNSHFVMSPIVELGRGASDELLLKLEHNELLFKVLETANLKYGNFIFKVPEKYYYGASCGAGNRSLAITPSGNVKLCVMADENSILWGNISQDGLRELLLKSKEISSFFRNAKAPSPELCGECDYNVFCGFCLTRGIKKYSEIKENCN